MPIKWMDTEPATPKKRIRWEDEPVSTDQINSRVATAFDAVQNDPNLALGEGLYERGAILPFAKNKLTGEVSLAVPGIIQAGIDAAKLPGEVYAGQEQLYDQEGNLRPEVITRLTDLAAFGPAGTFVKQSAKTVAPAIRAARQNVDDAAQYGIDLTRGQATRRFADQAFEQDAITGGRGKAAQVAMEAQRAKQSEQVKKAAQGLTDNLSTSRVADPYEAVDNVSGALQKQAANVRGKSDALYKAAEGANAEIAPDSIASLSQRFRIALDNAGAMEGVSVAREYPTAARTLQRVDTLMSKAPDGNVTGVGWQNVERVRRMLNNKGSGPDETRVLGEMRKEFDSWLEDSVHNALVSGDPKFLSDLTEARGLWRQYKQIVGNDSAIIRKMADGSANSEQVANWLYGAAKVGGRSDASNTVREIKTLIGGNHPAIEDLKRGVAMRLFQDKAGEIKTPGKLASDILEFTNSKGHELAKELYGEKNLAQLRRFAGVLRQLTPDDIATNPSRSGQTIMRRFSETFRATAPILGMAYDGLSGFIGGIVLQGAAARAAKAKAVRQIMSPVPSQIALPGSREIVPAGIRGTVLALEQDPQLPRLQQLLPQRY